MNQFWESPEEQILDNGGRNGMLAGRLVESKGELNVCMPSAFQADIVPPPQSAADATGTGV